MTTTTVDVNEAFRAERVNQIATAQEAAERNAKANAERAASFDARIAAGTLRSLGNDRFQVVDPSSWDNGEILYRKVNEVGQSLILPEHNLDESTGRVALFSRVPAWHLFGENGELAGDEDVDEVMRKGAIDWLVEDSPVLYLDHEGNLRTAPDKVVKRRSDTGAALGVVGKTYGTIQNRESFEFLMDLVSNYGCVWESAGALFGGKRTFVTLRLPENIVVDPEGINDQIIPFLAAFNSHNGSGGFKVVATPWRPVCGNTERFAQRDAATTWTTRHTRKALDRLNEARRTLKLADKFYGSFVVEETKLAQTAADVDEVDRLIKSLWEKPGNDETEAVKATWDKRRTSIVGLYENEPTTGTLYAAERAVTEYLDNVAPMRPRKSLGLDLAATRGQAALEGTSDDKKTAAHKLLMTRAGA